MRVREGSGMDIGLGLEYYLGGKFTIIYKKKQRGGKCKTQ